MNDIRSFQDVIDAWPSRREFALECGISLSAANKMFQLDSIRGVYFKQIVDASRERHGGGAISAEDLIRVAARSKEQGGARS